MSATSFGANLSKHYDHSAAENRWYSFWEGQGYFHSDPDSDCEPYCIVIPPPNVTGALHLGHALNTTLQDVLIRFKRMQGRATLWMPGTDHAGIATQAVVERRLLEEEQLTRHDLGRDKLVQRIWDWKEQYEARIIRQLQQMGCSCDWSRTRFTLDEMCARAVRRTFFSLFEQELIYRGKRLTNWDTVLQTAVSDDEVFHETVAGSFWHFLYPVIEPRLGEPEHVSVATTRPETMLGDTAVAVHPDPESALDARVDALRAKHRMAAEKEKEDLAREMENLQQRREKILPKLLMLRDMAADGRRLRLPLMEREIPLISDPWAKPEIGSGCVKITPAHDPNDYEVGLRAKLPMINILNPDGTLNFHAGRYQGLTIEVARKRVVVDLNEAGLLEEVEKRQIDLAHSDRSKAPIEPFLADQWFVKMEQLAQSAMDAVNEKRVSIFPERYAKGYLDWLSERRDWPVGRQLWWGHRIPIWSQTVSSGLALEALIDQLEDDLARGIVSYQIEAQEDSNGGQGGSCGSGTITGQESVSTVHVCIAEEDDEIEKRYEEWGFKQDPDVLDTWFSSALWPHSTLGWPEATKELEHYYPTSTLITSRDIITLWVARMVLTGIHNMGEVPFREVYIHPKILDGYGEGMSKSKGNGVDPVDVLQKFGADALRFALAHLTTETQDVRMPVEFECPRCQARVEQTKKNRMLPRINCRACQQDFATQWAAKPEDKALPRAMAVSERFELGRNFCNKLWNAARFALLNLQDFTPAVVDPEELRIEDRWILSRLATTTADVTEALDHYKYADVTRMLYEFSWDEFCSFYLEMLKERLQCSSARPVAQRVLAHTLDVLLRLLHPLVPFLTEEVWHLLAQVAPQRGLIEPGQASDSVMIAPWPTVDAMRQDATIETRFSQFQTVLGTLREIRSRQNIPPKTQIQFRVCCDEAVQELLEPLAPYFQSMAQAEAVAWGLGVEPTNVSANMSLPWAQIFVDLEEHLDIDAEIAKLGKEIFKWQSFKAEKEKKLSNEHFVHRAPAPVVERERTTLEEIERQLAAATSRLAVLKEVKLDRNG